MIKFSIIVPVYNTEKYLDNCINSVIAQTYDNFELILIDDGSTDNSPMLCDEWAKKDSRIKAIHKPNGGVSSARNEGIRQAVGDNIIFIDADDFIHKELLERSLQYADDYDVINYDWISISKIEEVTEYYDKNVQISTFEAVGDRALYLKSKMSAKQFNTVCWRSCYKTSFLKENNLFFDERYFLAEDVLFNIKLMLSVSKMIEINFGGIYHYWNPDSVCYNLRGEEKINYMNTLAFNLFQDLKGQKEYADIFPYIYLYLVEIGQEFIDINQPIGELFKLHEIKEHKDFYLKNIKKALKQKRKIRYNEFRPLIYKEQKIKRAFMFYTINHSKLKLKCKLFWINLTLPFVRLKTKIARRLKGLFKRGKN